MRTLMLISVLFCWKAAGAQIIVYTMPEETGEHEGTWLQCPHNHMYDPYYRDDLESTWIAMTSALQSGEKAHIISVLNGSGIPELVYCH